MMFTKVCKFVFEKIRSKKIYEIYELRKVAIRIACTYIIFSALWILFSDSLVSSLQLDRYTTYNLSIIKGLLFVLVTGTILYLLINRSIIQLRRSEEELRKKDEIYRAVISGTTDGLWEMNTQTEEFYQSPFWKEKGGYEDGELLNTLNSWKSLLHPEDRDSTIKELYDYMNKRITKYNCEYRLRMKDRSYIWLHSKGQGIWDENGEIIRLFGTHTDITQRKAIEEELKKANENNVKLLNEAIKYEKLKTEFFANISHEFKTPLAVLLASIQLIESYHCTDDSKCEKYNKLTKQMKVIKQNSNRLLKLINNLIDITKIDSGFLELNTCNVNIVNVIEQITLSIKEFIENKSITLVFDTDVEEKFIVCDINVIERIVLNLLSNATKYNKPGGSILVEMSDFRDYIEIAVKDTGIGIPEKEIGMVFERFRKVNDSLTREHEGSGIGLSIVKSLVVLHEGDISVESEIDKGSTFKVKLPVKLKNYEAKYTIEDEGIQKYLFTSSIEFSDI